MPRSDVLTRWAHLYDLLDVLSVRVRAAIVNQDRAELASQLGERAWVEMRLRDMWPRGSRPWRFWSEAMERDTIRMAGLARAPRLPADVVVDLLQDRCSPR